MVHMEPSSSETPGIELPAPQQMPGEAAAGAGETDPFGSAVEQAPSGPEKTMAPRQGASAAAVPPITLPLPQPAPTAGASDDASATTPAISATVVDDGDLIEKEWVSKAKQIVEKNRNDPYKQSEELTVFKADYMKKRYDKNIKIDK